MTLRKVQEFWVLGCVPDSHACSKQVLTSTVQQALKLKISVFSPIHSNLSTYFLQDSSCFSIPFPSFPSHISQDLQLPPFPICVENRHPLKLGASSLAGWCLRTGNISILYMSFCKSTSSLIFPLFDSSFPQNLQKFNSLEMPSRKRIHDIILSGDRGGGRWVTLFRHIPAKRMSVSWVGWEEKRLNFITKHSS